MADGEKGEKSEKVDKSEKNVRDKNLSIALSQIEKEYGKGSIMRLGDNMHVDVPIIST
ncbi:MAG: hypothetical protein NT118_11605, partial [Lentisphaerae bacterium]|nr:hypothetical protein [Lentisphaerota bacterium]